MGGRRHPPEQEWVRVAADGQVTALRTVCVGVVGTFTGSGLPGPLAARLASAAAAAQAEPPPGDGPPPGAASETIQIGGELVVDDATRFVGTQGAWNDLLQTVREVLDAATSFPEATLAIALDAAGSGIVLSNPGTQPVTVDLAAATVIAIAADEYGGALARTEAPAAADADAEHAAPGWTWRLPLPAASAEGAVRTRGQLVATVTGPHGPLTVELTTP